MSYKFEVTMDEKEVKPLNLNVSELTLGDAVSLLGALGGNAYFKRYPTGQVFIRAPRTPKVV